MALQVFIYFQYFDEFSSSQNIHFEKLHGVMYPRIVYGNELWLDEDGKPYIDENGIEYDYPKIASRPCHDCAATKSQYHCDGCDVEQCPRCKGQYLSCDCKIDSDFDDD